MKKIILSMLVVLALTACNFEPDTEFENLSDREFIGILSGEDISIILFEEDFSSELDSWSISVSPSIENRQLSSDRFSISTVQEFSGKNGIELSFDVLPVQDPAIYSGFVVKLVEKGYSANEAKAEIRADGSVVYWIKGHCVGTPQVQSGSIKLDNEFHKLTFRAHTDGSAEWLLDNEVQMQRADFDTGGDYTIMLSGSSGQNMMFLDNIQLFSLGEIYAGEICTPAVKPAANTCQQGYCLSNGVCCPSTARYYCEGKCYASSNAALAASQGRCVNFRIVC